MPEVIDPEKKTQFLADLDRAPALSTISWANNVREAARARFGELPLPHRRQEDWRFTNIAPIINTDFRSAIEPSSHGLSVEDLTSMLYRDEHWIELVFIDGFYAPELSTPSNAPDGVRVGNLAGDLGSDAALVETHLNRYAGINGNAYAALNAAFLLDGAMVHIGQGTVCDRPIHLVHVSSGKQPETATYPRNLVVAEALSQATIVESYVGLDAEAVYLHDVVTEYALGESAQVTRYKVLQEGAQGYHLASSKVHQERASQFQSYSFVLGGKIARNELSIQLDGEGAGCSLHGLYLADGDMLVDNATSVDHAQPHCESWIGYKGVLDDSSKGVFSGKVMVRRDAQKTSSNQLNQNLLLSDTATIDTKPLLEIFADDVKCTHGATVGQHPPEIIFYFKSRGMHEEMARGMLTYGFADQVVNEVDLVPLRKRLDKFVFDRYSPEAIRKHA